MLPDRDRGATKLQFSDGVSSSEIWYYKASIPIEGK
ncbi:uncharacterized protein G2W53_029193 [Senna tora]|uniref:Uncharacterized protein n=1 Tax=Senna tora TaxID=362788 RepID=A0A834WFI1_9FABA|nr:uncharacterized protein G2W53_029193 [Senna tora]